MSDVDILKAELFVSSGMSYFDIKIRHTSVMNTKSTLQKIKHCKSFIKDVPDEE